LRDSIQLEMHFSLKKLVASHNLQQPDQPFTQEDIDEEVKHLASDNAFITLVPKVNRAGGVKPEDHRVGVPVQEVEGRRSKAKGGEDHPRRNDPVL
jgi:hypothetical protein